MLNVKLICVGKMKEKFYNEAYSEYNKRLAGFCRLELLEIPEQRLPDIPTAGEISAALDREAAEILKAIPGDACVVTLCVEGKLLSSEDLAKVLKDREMSGKPRLCLIIGGSYGLSDRVKERSDLRMSMSRMTFPHHLARVIVMEQLYRGFKINEGSRYHK